MSCSLLCCVLCWAILFNPLWTFMHGSAEATSWCWFCGWVIILSIVQWIVITSNARPHNILRCLSWIYIVLILIPFGLNECSWWLILFSLCLCIAAEGPLSYQVARSWKPWLLNYGGSKWRCLLFQMRLWDQKHHGLLGCTSSNVRTVECNCTSFAVFSLNSA